MINITSHVISVKKSAILDFALLTRRWLLCDMDVSVCTLAYKALKNIFL